MSEKGEAFVKGGCGCLIAFVAIGLCCVLIGGSMHIDLGGAILLFVLGGIVGLIVLSIYNKGKSDAQSHSYTQDNDFDNKHSDS